MVDIDSIAQQIYVRNVVSDGIDLTRQEPDLAQDRAINAYKLAEVFMKVRGLRTSNPQLLASDPSTLQL